MSALINIEFRHLSTEHIEPVRQYITNPLVCIFLSWQPYHKENDIQDYFSYAKSCTNFPDEILCIIYEDRCVGTAHILKREGRIAQIGFGILPEYWNKGIGTTVCEKIINYIRESRWFENIDILRAVIAQQNTAALKIIAKLGFVLDKINTKPGFNSYQLMIKLS